VVWCILTVCTPGYYCGFFVWFLITSAANMVIVNKADGWTVEVKRANVSMSSGGNVSVFFSVSEVDTRSWRSAGRSHWQSLHSNFISSRLDYCNSVFHVLTDIQLRRLQSVHNTATLLVTHENTPVLCLETSTGCQYDDAMTNIAC